MKRVTICLTAAIVLFLLGTSAFAHEITFKGTVVSADKAIIKVTVVDEKTKKPVQMNFKCDKETKILRADVVLTFEQARIQKNEKIAVTVDHDFDIAFAVVVRLEARK